MDFRFENISGLQKPIFLHSNFFRDVKITFRFLIQRKQRLYKKEIVQDLKQSARSSLSANTIHLSKLKTQFAQTTTQIQTPSSEYSYEQYPFIKAQN